MRGFKVTTVETQFLEPSIFQTSRKLEPAANVVSLSVEQCNFSNQFFFPLQSRKIGIFLYFWNDNSFIRHSLFQALGQWGRWKALAARDVRRAGSGRERGNVSSFSTRPHSSLDTICERFSLLRFQCVSTTLTLSGIV